MSRGGGGRRVISHDLADRKRKAEEEEEANNPILAELRDRAREAEKKLSKKKEENDPLFQFIIDSFKEEMERDFARREERPELPWGPSFKQQLEDAQVEEEYRELLRDLRLLYKHEKPDSELRILAFVRRDRLQTERLAAKKAKEDPEGARFVTSPAADLADYRTYLKKEEEVKEEETEKEEGTEKKEDTEKEKEKDNNGDEKEIKKEVKQEDIKAE